MCKKNSKNNNLTHDEFHVLSTEEIDALSPKQKEHYYRICNSQNDEERKSLIDRWNKLDAEKRKARMNAQK